MKLFLTSSLDKTLELLPKKLSGPLSGKKVLFIANASDNAIGDKWWIDLDRKAFERSECVISDIDLRNISVHDFAVELTKHDIVHFCGGSVLYLASLMRRGGFVDALIDSVRGEDILYTGTSAGSMVAAKDLSLNRWDPEEQAYVVGMEDFSGIGLVNFLILPHSNSKDFVESNLRMVEKLPEYNQAVVVLYDNQAIWVEDTKLEILSA